MDPIIALALAGGAFVVVQKADGGETVIGAGERGYEWRGRDCYNRVTGNKVGTAKCSGIPNTSMTSGYERRPKAGGGMECVNKVTGAHVATTRCAGQAPVPGAAGPLGAALVGSSSSYIAGKPGTGVDSAIEAEVIAKAKAAFDSLGEAAKKAACGKLKADYPNSPSIQSIDCEKGNFDAVMKAIAAAAGTAACAATGAGAAVSPLCGIAAAWIAGWAGPKLKEWASDAYGGVKDAASEVGDFIKFW
jgi:hypothetical protein